MKKYLPWILIGVLVLVIIILVTRKKSDDGIQNTNGSNKSPDLITQASSGIPEITQQYAQRCECMYDPTIQRTIDELNSAPTLLKAGLRDHIHTLCPCIPFNYLN